MTDTTNLPPSVRDAINNAPPPPNENQTIGQAYSSRKKSRGGGSSGGGSSSQPAPTIAELQQAGTLQEEVTARRTAQDLERQKQTERVKQLNNQEKALALAVAQQEVKFSPKAEAVRSQELAKLKQNIPGEQSTVKFMGGRLQATGIIPKFSPDKSNPNPFFKDYMQEETQVYNPVMDQETGLNVRYTMQEKAIDQTQLKFTLADLSAYARPTATIERAQPFYTKQINTLLDFEVIESAKNRPKNVLDWAKKGIELSVNKGLALEYDLGRASFGSVSLLVLGTVSRTAYDVSPIGIGESLITKGVLGTVDAYNPGNILTAIKDNTLLKSKTLIGKVAESGALIIGAELGGKTTGSVATKVYDVAYRIKDKIVMNKLNKKSTGDLIPERITFKDTKLNKGVVLTEATLNPPGALNYKTPQTTFSKVTEGGKIVKQFGEDFPNDIKRVISDKKTGKVKRVIDPLSANLPEKLTPTGKYIPPSERLTPQQLAKFNKAQTKLPQVLVESAPYTESIIIDGITYSYSRGSVPVITNLKDPLPSVPKLKASKPGVQSNLGSKFFDTARSELDLSFDFNYPDMVKSKRIPETKTPTGLTNAQKYLDDFKFSGDFLKDARLSKWERLGKVAENSPIFSQGMLSPALITVLKPDFKVPQIKAGTIAQTFEPVVTSLKFDLILEPPRSNVLPGSGLINPPRGSQDEDESIKPIFVVKPNIKLNVITPSDQQNRVFTETFSGLKSNSKPEIDVKPKEEQKDKIDLYPFPVPKIDTDQKTNVRLKDLTKPKETTKKIPALKYRPPQESINLFENKLSLFNVLVKKKGQYVRVGAPLPKNKALRFGINYIDITPQASFKLQETGEKSAIKDFASPGRLDKVYKKGGVYIERNKFRIDMGGELLGITKKGQSAQRFKGLLGNSKLKLRL